METDPNNVVAKSSSLDDGIPNMVSIDVQSLPPGHDY